MRISDWSSDVCSSDLWHMLEYFTLLALALVGLGIAMPFASDVAHFVAGFLSFVALITLIVLMMLQNWQGREHAKKIGRASCRERVGQYVSLRVIAVSLKKKIK